MNIAAVLILGAVGGIARFALEGLGLFGTIAVNLIGSFLLGVIGELVIHKPTTPWIRDGVIIGLLGCFTTFSSFVQGSEQLLSSGMWAAALFTVCGVVGGLSLYWLGEHTVKWIIKPSQLQRTHNQEHTANQNYVLSPLWWSRTHAEPHRDRQE